MITRDFSDLSLGHFPIVRLPYTSDIWSRDYENAAMLLVLAILAFVVVLMPLGFVVFCEIVLTAHEHGERRRRSKHLG